MKSPSTSPLVLNTRAGSSNCDALEALLARARLAYPYAGEWVDVARDPALQEAYGLSVPVLTLDGRALTKGRADAGELARRFDRLAQEWLARERAAGRVGA
jgi:hypothetical protein